MNLFINTRKLTKQKEDHLTEFLASAILIDEQFRRKYEEIVLYNFAENRTEIYK